MKLEKQLSCVIIDDEPKAIKLLKLMIEELDMGVEVIGSFHDPVRAIDSLLNLEPDFLFLDIQMPEMSGFDLLEKLPRVDLPVIFVTGYDSFAVRAIKISAVDYLVKPISIDELQLSIFKVNKRISWSNAMQQNKVLLDNVRLSNSLNRSIGVPSVEGIDFIPLKEIIYFEGSDRYTKVVSENRHEIFSSYNLGEFAKLLTDSFFFQSHRSFIVNLTKISKYDKDGLIQLSNGENIPLARRRKDAFLARMKNNMPSRQ